MLSQFSPEPGSRWRSLAEFIPVPRVYAAGRLDADSEGLLLLTDSGQLQRRLTDPSFGHWRTYWVQVEGEASQKPEALEQLRDGVVIQGRRSRLARVRCLGDPKLAERNPPIRQRACIPVSWLELQLREGRNRQVRRMTASVGLPTLRLIRVAIDLMDGEAPLGLEGLPCGEWRPLHGEEELRLQCLLRHSPGRGGRAGGGK